MGERGSLVFYRAFVRSIVLSRSKFWFVVLGVFRDFEEYFSLL